MSMLGAYQKYKTLNPDQKRLLGEKSVEGSRTPEEWLGLLKDVSEFDRIGDAGRSGAGKLAIILLISTVILLFVSGLLGQLIPGWIPIVLLILCVLGAIISGLIYFKLKKVDLPNRLRQFIVPVIAILREDIEPSALLNLRIDLRGPIGEKEMNHQEDSSGYPKIKITNYADSWFSGGANLADSSSLQWQLIDYIRQRKVTKRNPRGKIKSKTKYKIQTLIEVKLGMRSKDYTPVAPDPSGEVSLKTGEKRNHLRIRHVEHSTELNSPLDFKVFLDAVTAAYKQVKPQAS